MDPRFSGSDPLNLEERAASPPAASTIESAPARPRVWTAIAAGAIGPIFGGILAFALIGAVMDLIARQTGSGGMPTRSGVMALMRTPAGAFTAIVGSELGIALVAYFAAIASPVPWARRLGLVRPAISARHLALAVLASIGAIVVGVAVLAIAVKLGAPMPSAWRGELSATLRNASPGWAAALVLAASLMPGFSEELLYRGFVQRRLLESWPTAAAIGVSAAMFAMAHGDLAYALFTLPAGIWLGYVAWRTGSVIPSMVCHALVNGVFQSLLVLGPDDPERVPPSFAIAIAATAFVAVFAIVPAARALARSGSSRDAIARAAE